MPRRKSPYSGGSIGFPSVILAGAWAGLWLLWPPLDFTSTPARRLPDVRVSYVKFGAGQGSLYMKPYLFGLPSRVGFRFRFPEDDSGVPAGLSGHCVNHSRLLDRDEAVVKKVAVSDIRGRSVELGEYRPHLEPVSAFSRKAAGEMRTLVMTSGELKDKGFQVPEFPEGVLKQFDKPWRVAVYVEIGNDGRVEHVFLESGNHDPAVDAAVVRHMHRGKLSRPGTGCTGRVTVSFGAP